MGFFRGPRVRLLDLFCGAGGCSAGYARAGFHVTGVDLAWQPNYCGDEFLRMDVLETLSQPEALRANFDAIHASPPCQAFTTMSNRWRGAGERADEHPALIAEVRELLERTGLPYVIENVPGARAEMRAAVQLSGGMFGLGVHRPRLFEANFPILVPPPIAPPKDSLGVYGKAHDGRRLFTRSDGSEQRAPRTLKEACEAMEIAWMEWDELREAIPPAYTELIGHQLMDYLRVSEAA